MKCLPGVNLCDFALLMNTCENIAVHTDGKFRPVSLFVSYNIKLTKLISVSDLNLSHNQMSKLPEELADLAELERLDISHNAYIALPHVVYKMPKLSHLHAQNNHIVGM